MACPPYSPDLTPADFWQFPSHQPYSSDVEDITSSAQEFIDIPVQRVNYYVRYLRPWENVKDGHETPLKDFRLLNSEALK
jgi:hypothetical protein